MKEYLFVCLSRVHTRVCEGFRVVTRSWSNPFLTLSVAQVAEVNCRLLGSGSLLFSEGTQSIIHRFDRKLGFLRIRIPVARNTS